MTEDKISETLYSYTADVNQLEDENKLLKDTVNRLNNELEKFRTPPLLICEIKEIANNHAYVKLNNGNEFYVSIADSCEKLRAGDSALAEQKNLTLVKKIALNSAFSVEKFVIIEKPEVKWSQIGGLKKQIREIQEVIELPLKKPELFKKIGITPPKGVLLYGPPGTGKTLLAKAVAKSTKSTFIEVVGSEIVQKFIGEGAKLVKEIFELARAKAPSVIFIDEIDALAAKRIELGTSGEREVQRTFMQLLAEIDGFKNLGNVKIIGATNRRDILDPAIIRPGRLDRMIKVDITSDEERREIFNIHTKNMTLDHVKPDILIKEMKNMSGAEIKAVCTEAGYFAIREDQTTIKQKYFRDAIKKVKEEEELEGKDFMGMFG